MNFREKQAKNLQKYLYKHNIFFIKLDLLKKSITHSTYSYENKLLENNQRLEFLGDTILGFIVSEYLYYYYPLKNEGELSRIKGKIVSKKFLSEAAKKINLYDFICIGKGEHKVGGIYKDSILSDTLESLIAAIYLELGYSVVKKFISKILLNELENLLQQGIDDYKTILQEIVQKKYKKNIIYKTLEEFGPDHNKNFLIGIFWQNKLISTGFGKNKKDAESISAKLAINYFSKKIESC